MNRKVIRKCMKNAFNFFFSFVFLKLQHLYQVLLAPVFTKTFSWNVHSTKARSIPSDNHTQDRSIRKIHVLAVTDTDLQYNVILMYTGICLSNYF